LVGEVPVIAGVLLPITSELESGATFVKEGVCGCEPQAAMGLILAQACFAWFWGPAFFFPPLILSLARWLLCFLLQSSTSGTSFSTKPRAIKALKPRPKPAYLHGRSHGSLRPGSSLFTCFTLWPHKRSSLGDTHVAPSISSRVPTICRPIIPIDQPTRVLS